MLTFLLYSFIFMIGCFVGYYLGSFALSLKLRHIDRYIYAKHGFKPIEEFFDKFKEATIKHDNKNK